MKKKHVIFAILGVFALLTSTLVFAVPLDDTARDNGVLMKKPSIIAIDDAPPQSVRIKGIWGYMDDRTPDGYFGGKITKKGRFAIFHGVCNETGSENRIPIVGIMKRGYFNGKITTDDRSYRVMGLYKIDMEKHILKLKWMTAYSNGWAVARINLPSQ